MVADTQQGARGPQGQGIKNVGTWSAVTTSSSSGPGEHKQLVGNGKQMGTILEQWSPDQPTSPKRKARISVTVQVVGQGVAAGPRTLLCVPGRAVV
jgi:hypothetical protein